MCPLFGFGSGAVSYKTRPIPWPSCDLGHSDDSFRGAYRRNAFINFALLTDFTNSVSVLRLFSTSSVVCICVGRRGLNGLQAWMILPVANKRHTGPEIASHSKRILSVHIQLWPCWVVGPSLSVKCTYTQPVLVPSFRGYFSWTGPKMTSVSFLWFSQSGQDGSCK